MPLRAQVRRAFPYLVIAVAGFALAYVIVFMFVLPSQIIPGRASSVPGSTPGRIPAGGEEGGESLAAPPPETTLASPVPFSPPAGGASPPEGSAGTVEVPNLVQMALSDALALLHDLRLSAKTQRDTSSLQPQYTILRQAPPAGTALAPDESVTLTVSVFPPRTAAPSGDSSTHPAPDTTSH